MNKRNTKAFRKRLKRRGEIHADAKTSGYFKILRSFNVKKILPTKTR